MLLFSLKTVHTLFIIIDGGAVDDDVTVEDEMMSLKLESSPIYVELA